MRQWYLTKALMNWELLLTCGDILQKKDAIAGHKLFVEVFSRRAAKGKNERSEVSKLTLEIELKNTLIAQLQNENGFLKQEYMNLKQEYVKVNDKLESFLLPVPLPTLPTKKSLWDKLRQVIKI